MWVKIILALLSLVLISLTLVSVYIYKVYGEKYPWTYWIPVGLGNIFDINSIVLFILMIMKIFTKKEI